MSKKTIMMMSALFLLAGVLIGALYNALMSKRYDKQECSMSLVVFIKAPARISR